MEFPRVLALLAALVGCGAPGGTASGAGDPTALPDEQRDAVLQAARAVLAAGSCREASAAIADPAIRLDDQRFRGALWQPVRVEGCGRRSRLNMLVAPASAPGGAPGVVQLLPGTTAADPLAQREGLRLALRAVGDAAPGCDRIAVNDTRGDAAQAAGEAARRPWAEVWTLSACGRAYAVPVRFAPGRGGTEITVDPAAVRPVEAP